MKKICYYIKNTPKVLLAWLITMICLLLVSVTAFSIQSRCGQWVLAPEVWLLIVLGFFGMSFVCFAGICDYWDRRNKLEK